MKKINLLSLLLLALLCIGFVSCSDDDDDDDGINKQEESILGTWIFSKNQASIELETNNAEFTEVFSRFLFAEYTYNREWNFTDSGILIEKYKERISETGFDIEITEYPYIYSKGILNIQEMDPLYDNVATKIISNNITLEYDLMLDNKDDDFLSMITYVINSTESLKLLNPSDIKVTKAILKEVGVRESTSGTEDEEIIVEEKEESIVGTWGFLKEDIKVESKTNNADFTKPLTDLFVAETFDPILEITFKEDGTFISVSTWNSIETHEGTYTYKNGVLTLVEDRANDEDDEDKEPAYSIKILGNTMTLEVDYIDTYSFGWLIDSVIKDNESFKDLDSASIKVEKMVVQRVGTRK